MAPRRIRLCADDYGIAPGVNAAIRDLIARRRLNATSVMVVAPALDREAVDSLLQVAADARAEIGLHLTLTAPFAPLTGPFPPLRGGTFLPLGRTLLAALSRAFDPRNLSAEIDAQLDTFIERFGRAPDFVDGHQHAHLFPQVREAVLAAVSARAPRAWVRQCGRANGRRVAVGDPKGLLIHLLSRRFRALAAAHGLAVNPAFAGTYRYGPAADFATLFPRFLDGLPDGGPVMCHPGRVDAALERLDPLTHLREREYAYLEGETFLADLAAANVRLL